MRFQVSHGNNDARIDSMKKKKQQKNKRKERKKYTRSDGNGKGI